MKKLFLLIILSLILFSLICAVGFAQEMTDMQMQQYQMNFTGKWDPTHDPLILDEKNYADIQNMRYRDKGMEGVSGYSKINTTALSTYLKIKSGFHFVKEEPAESHVLVQSYNSGETASQILQNTTAIPSQGDFSATALHTDASGAGKGVFSDGPQGTALYSNGEESLLWGGTESTCYTFLNYAPDDSFLYDYSEQISNTLTDSGNIATLYTGSGSGIDSDVMLLLHLDNNVTDSSPTTPHTVTDVGSNLTYSSSDYVFATHSAVFDGTSAYMTVPDNADFDFSGGIFTIDAWIKIDSLAADRVIYYQETAGTGNDWCLFQVETTGEVRFEVTSDNVGSPQTDVELETAQGLIAVDIWNHIELVESGDNWYIFVNGIQRAYVSDAGRNADYTGVVQVGYDGSTYFSGKMDEFRVSDVARHTDYFNSPAAAYSTSTTECNIYIGSTRPLDGFKLYSQTANTSTSTMAVQEWTNAAGWSAVSSLSDGTSSGGISLAQTGSVTFDDTVSTSKSKYLKGRSLYFYRVNVSAVSSGTQIYYVTLSAPFQNITNVWSGDFSTVAMCKKTNGTVYYDYTVEVNANDTTLYGDFHAGGGYYILLGFLSPQQAFDIELVATKENTTASIMSVYYYDGDDWVLFPYSSDGTAVGAITLTQSGVVSFISNARGVEQKLSVVNGEPEYYVYKLEFSAALDGEVHVNLVFGIEAPDELLPYNLPIEFQNRVLLCSRKGDLSEVRISASNAPNVFNGTDTTILNLGGNSKFVAGAGLYNKLGSSLYSVAVLCKIAQTWILNGYAISGEGQFTTKKVSDTVGCIAPRTMTTCEVGFLSNEQSQRNVAMWLAHGGVYLFDGGVLKKIKGIEPYFDITDSRCINYSSADISYGFFDADHQEYNLLIPSGSGQTTCNVWLIYDMLRNKWTKKVPPTYPQSGFTVRATYGENFNYLGLDTGYLLRNEHGNNFDGSDIEQFIITSDILPTTSLFEEIRLDYMKFVCEAKTGDEDSISIYHRADADTDWTTLTSVPMYATDKRIVQHVQRLNKIGVGNQFKFQVSTDDKANGFEPIAFGMLYHPVRLDLTPGVRN